MDRHNQIPHHVEVDNVEEGNPFDILNLESILNQHFPYTSEHTEDAFATTFSSAAAVINSSDHTSFQVERDTNQIDESVDYDDYLLDEPEGEDHPMKLGQLTTPSAILESHPLPPVDASSQTQAEHTSWYFNLTPEQHDWIFEMVAHYTGLNAKQCYTWYRTVVIPRLSTRDGGVLLDPHAKVEDVVAIIQKITDGSSEPYKVSLLDVKHTLMREGISERSATRYMTEARNDLSLRGEPASIIYHSIIDKWNQRNPYRHRLLKEYRPWRPGLDQ